MTVHLHKAPVDFRKQINGLSVIVSEAMAIDPFKPALFVFTNRNRDRVKILYWDKNGFCLWDSASGRSAWRSNALSGRCCMKPMRLS